VTGYSPKNGKRKDVPIVSAYTLYQSRTGECIILKFHQSLWFGDELPYSLINPNQVRAIGMNVQDNPFSDQPMTNTDLEESISIEIGMKGIVAGWDTVCPTEEDLLLYPSIDMTSDLPWNPEGFNSEIGVVMSSIIYHYRRIRKRRLLLRNWPGHGSSQTNRHGSHYKQQHRNS